MKKCYLRVPTITRALLPTIAIQPRRSLRRPRRYGEGAQNGGDGVGQLGGTTLADNFKELFDNLGLKSCPMRCRCGRRGSNGGIRDRSGKARGSIRRLPARGRQGSAGDRYCRTRQLCHFRQARHRLRHDRGRRICQWRQYLAATGMSLTNDDDDMAAIVSKAISCRTRFSPREGVLRFGSSNTWRL